MAIYKVRRDELENQLNKSALWAVIYGDLMSYLMVLFLVLFSFSLAKSDRERNRKYEESLANIQKIFGGMENKKRVDRAKAMENEEKIISKIKNSVKKDMSEFVEIESSEQKIKLVLKESVLFDSGKADLKFKARKVLRPIIEKLKELPNQVLVEGHTDNVPIKSGKYGSNWELSMARAYSVIRYMEDEGVPPARLSGIGYGEFRPIGDNTSARGRAKNRRIEISLIKTQ